MTGAPTWKDIGTAPQQDAHGNPVPIILFLPSIPTGTNRDGTPMGIVHPRQVGWYDFAQNAWVTGVHPKLPGTKVVYPSMWTDLLAEPTLS